MGKLIESLTYFPLQAINTSIMEWANPLGATGGTEEQSNWSLKLRRRCLTTSKKHNKHYLIPCLQTEICWIKLERLGNPASSQTRRVRPLAKLPIT
jgi:hypothetical protein